MDRLRHLRDLRRRFEKVNRAIPEGGHRALATLPPYLPNSFSMAKPRHWSGKAVLAVSALLFQRSSRCSQISKRNVRDLPHS